MIHSSPNRLAPTRVGSIILVRVVIIIIIIIVAEKRPCCWSLVVSSSLIVVMRFGPIQVLRSDVVVVVAVPFLLFRPILAPNRPKAKPTAIVTNDTINANIPARMGGTPTTPPFPINTYVCVYRYMF